MKRNLENKKEKEMFTGSKLDFALRFIRDSLESCQIPFVLIGEGARQLKENKDAGKPLVVEKIELATEKKYLTQDTVQLLKTPGMFPEAEIKDTIELEYDGIPVEIKVLNKHYKFMENPDMAFYMADEYKLPNPFEGYWKARYLIS